MLPVHALHNSLSFIRHLSCVLPTATATRRMGRYLKLYAVRIVSQVSRAVVHSQAWSDLGAVGAKGLLEGAGGGGRA